MPTDRLDPEDPDPVDLILDFWRKRGIDLTREEAEEFWRKVQQGLFPEIEQLLRMFLS